MLPITPFAKSGLSLWTTSWWKPLCPEIRITAYQYFNRQHLRNCPSSNDIVRPTLIMDLSICPDATSRDAVLLLQPRYSARPLMPCIRLDALCWRSARCSSIHSSNCATVRSVTIVVGVISISILWIKWMIRLCVLNGHLRRPTNLSVPSGSLLVFILNQFVDLLSWCAIPGEEGIRQSVNPKDCQ